jgi:beta-mannosidase
MSQEAQAAALKAGIEWLAANRPRCMGALIWQLNDAWPGFSWSLIDSEGKPKPAYFAVREAFGKIEG